MRSPSPSTRWYLKPVFLTHRDTPFTSISNVTNNKIPQPRGEGANVTISEEKFEVWSQSAFFHFTFNFDSVPLLSPWQLRKASVVNWMDGWIDQLMDGWWTVEVDIPRHLSIYHHSTSLTMILLWFLNFCSMLSNAITFIYSLFSTANYILNTKICSIQ